MAFRGRGRTVYHKTRQAYQQQTFNRGRFTKSQDPIPREDCYDENVYEVENILLDNVDPMRPDSLPRFTPINKMMYLGFSSESSFKTAVSAVALKPEFDAWLNQKKLQVQMENQASLFKLTQSDLSNTISPAISQITDTVKEVQEMVKSVVNLTKIQTTNQTSKRHSQSLSDGEEMESPPRKKQKSRSYRKKSLYSESSDEEISSPVKRTQKKKPAPKTKKSKTQPMEEGSEDGEMRNTQKRRKPTLNQEPTYVDSEIDEKNQPSAYDGEILEIEDQEEQESLLEAKKSYLKKALCGKSQSIIKKRLIYADMAWVRISKFNCFETQPDLRIEKITSWNNWLKPKTRQLCKASKQQRINS